MTRKKINWIGLVTSGIAILALVAAWLVVPEFRKWIGFETHDTQSMSKKMSVSGIVVDRDTNQGVGQALITLVGRTEQSLTEDSGNFKIDLPADAPMRIRLHVSKSGFQPLDTSIEPPVENLVLQLHKE